MSVAWSSSKSICGASSPSVSGRGRMVHSILALDQAARVLARGDVRQLDVTARRAEERDAGADEHRDAGDDEALDEPGAQEALDGDASVHIEVLEAAGGELG